MKNEKRVTEIVSQITAFSTPTCTKAEYLPELLKLQKELVDLTFNAEHADHGELRLWDVERHFRKLNAERNHAADDELAQFSRTSKIIGNNICAEISGNIGEQRVFRALTNLNCQNQVLKNVELEFDGKRTEIDAVVITNHAVFIIEIKNSKKDIFIDEDGGFYRTGNCMHYDCNIACKMDEREAFLRRVLDRAGMERVKIYKIITFTNPRIDVENKYRYIKVCGSNYLPVFIEKFNGDDWYTYENICTMAAAISEAKCSDSYQMPVDMNEFKLHFATLMVTLEEAGESTIEEANSVEELITEEVESTTVLRKAKQTTHRFSLCKVAVVLGITMFNIGLFVGSKLLKD